jgi:hypothetical protein
MPIYDIRPVVPMIKCRWRDPPAPDLLALGKQLAREANVSGLSDAEHRRLGELFNLLLHEQMRRTPWGDL